MSDIDLKILMYNVGMDKILPGVKEITEKNF